MSVPKTFFRFSSFFNSASWRLRATLATWDVYSCCTKLNRMEEDWLIHWGKIKEFYKENVNKGSGCQWPDCLGALNLSCWLLFSSDVAMPCYRQKHTFKWLKQTIYLSVCASCCVRGINAFSSRLLQTADYRDTASFYTGYRKQVAIFLVLSASLKKRNHG